MTVLDTLLTLGFTASEAETMMRTANLWTEQDEINKHPWTTNKQTLLTVEQINHEAMSILESRLNLLYNYKVTRNDPHP